MPAPLVFTFDVTLEVDRIVSKILKVAWRSGRARFSHSLLQLFLRRWQRHRPQTQGRRRTEGRRVPGIIAVTVTVGDEFYMPLVIWLC